MCIQTQDAVITQSPANSRRQIGRQWNEVCLASGKGSPRHEVGGDLVVRSPLFDQRRYGDGSWAKNCHVTVESNEAVVLAGL